MAAKKKKAKETKQKRKISEETLEHLRKGREKRKASLETKSTLSPKEKKTISRTVRTVQPEFVAPEIEVQDVQPLSYEELTEEQPQAQELASQSPDFAFGNNSNQDFIDDPSNVPGQELPGTLDHEDVWDFAYKRLLPLGDLPKYIVWKNGELLGEKRWPYSWTQMQKDHGGGHYRVQARSSSKGVIVKTQSIMIANTDGQSNQPPIREAPQEQPQIMSLEKIADIIQNLQDKIKNEAKQNDSMQIASQNNMSVAMMNMMQTQAKQTSDMIMQMTKFQMDMNNQQMTIMSKSLESIGQAIKETNSKKDDGMDFLKIMTLMKSEKSEAETNMMKWLDYVEKKVELARERSESEGGSDDSGGEKESITDTLIRSLAPAIGAIIAANAQNAQNSARSLPHNPNNVATMPSNPTRAENQPVRKPVAAVAKPATVEAGIKNVGASSQTSGPDVTVAPNAEQIKEVLLPIIVQDMTNAVDPLLTSKKCDQILLTNKIPKQKALEKFKIDDILNVAKGYNLPENQISWLKEVYANFSTTPIVHRKLATAASGQLQAQ
jgi:hypothetical protein